jgi:hypothetical protein
MHEEKRLNLHRAIHKLRPQHNYQSVENKNRTPLERSILINDQLRAFERAHPDASCLEKTKYFDFFKRFWDGQPIKPIEVAPDQFLLKLNSVKNQRPNYEADIDDFKTKQVEQVRRMYQRKS